MPEPQITIDAILNQAVAAAPLKKKMPVEKPPLSDDSTVYETYGCKFAASYPSVIKAQSFLGGIECEIETCQGKMQDFGIFNAKEDPSLRNGGCEYVSKPSPRQVLVDGFKDLHAFLNLDPAGEPFSHRTSTHVHVNVCSLTVKQTKNLILLYALFEEFFFSMVKPARRSNIHCVPLTETHLPAVYHKPLNYLVQKWSKYSALNLCRIPDLGTVEFRHHHGTGDAQELEIWLKVLDNLWTLSRQVVIDEACLSNPDRIWSWFSTIFQPSEKTMQLGGQLMNIIGNSLIDVKFSAIKE